MVKESNLGQSAASVPKYYASIVGPDGKERKVLVIPVMIRNYQSIFSLVCSHNDVILSSDLIARSK